MSESGSSERSRGDEVSSKKETKPSRDSLVEEIQSELWSSSSNYHANWIREIDTFERGACNVYGILTAKFSKKVRQEDESELKYSALEVIGRKFTQLYTAAHLRMFDQMEGYLRGVRALVAHCCDLKFNYVPKDYLPGFYYCLNGIEAYYLTRLPRWSCSIKRLKNSCKRLETFELLTVKAKVAVLAMKQSFIREMDRNSSRLQSMILNQMIKLDSTNGDWYHWRYNVLRFERCQQWRSSSPGNKELESIVTAAKLSPKNPRILITLYSFLAEMVRCHAHELEWNCSDLMDKINLGREFKTPIEIVIYLRGATRKVLVWDPTSIKVNITAAEIFSSTLPQQHLDVVFAKSCIERALIFHPNSSQANARMGVFLLTNNENRTEAIKYFIRSLEWDGRNFPTLLDLLSCYLSNHSTKCRSLELILGRELDNWNWDKPNVGRLLFVKGLHCYLLGNHQEALDNWIITYKLCGDILGFKNFGNLRKKYGWDNDRYALTHIYAMAESYRNVYSKSNKKRNIFDAVVSTMCEGLIKENIYPVNPKISHPFGGYSVRERGISGSDLQNRPFFGGPWVQWLKQNDANPKTLSSSASDEECGVCVEESPRVEETTHPILRLEPRTAYDEIKSAYRKLYFEVHNASRPL